MAKLQTISVKESATELTKLIGNSSPAIKPRLKMLLAIANGITATNELTAITGYKYYLEISITTFDV